MKSLPKLAVVVSVFLAFFVLGTSVKVQAQGDSVRPCTLQATRDFMIVAAPGVTIEVKNRQQFLGKLYPDKARIELNGIWYEVSRNNVSGCLSF